MPVVRRVRQGAGARRSVVCRPRSQLDPVAVVTVVEAALYATASRMAYVSAGRTENGVGSAVLAVTAGVTGVTGFSSASRILALLALAYANASAAAF